MLALCIAALAGATAAPLLPPLFPTLLRTSGAGFGYNIGRLAAALGSVVFGLFAPVGDFRLALLVSGGLALAAAAWTLRLPRDT